MIVAQRDNLTPPDLALGPYEEALHLKHLVLIDGGHSDAYDVLFDEAAGARLVHAPPRLIAAGRAKGGNGQAAASTVDRTSIAPAATAQFSYRKRMIFYGARGVHPSYDTILRTRMSG